MGPLANYSHVLVIAAQAATEFLAQFLSSTVYPRVQNVVPPGSREQYQWGYFQRLLPLLRSAARLDQVSFFQLVIAANRSLLEILVDVTHLHYSDPPDAAERIEAW